MSIVSSGGVPSRRRRLLHKNKSGKFPTKNSNCGTCSICGKQVFAVTGEPRPYPSSWPEELQIYFADAGNDIVHRQCLRRIQKLRTEFLSGAINERWSRAPPLGSPRSTQIEHQRQRRDEKKSKRLKKPFSSTVRSPTQTSLGTTMSRPSDSLHEKSKIRVPTPPSIVPFQHRANSTSKSRKNPSGAGATPQLHVETSSRGRKIKVRVLFS